MRRSIGAFVVAFLLPACGGGGGGSAGTGPNTTPYSVTDASGDFAITLDVLSATEIRVRWEDPTARYTLRPLSWSSSLYKNGVKIADAMSGFSYTDAGLAPDTGYSYRATVTALYQYLWTTISMGWASGTVSATTLYGLRVQETSPGAGEVDIPPSSPITATFNAAIAPDSVTSSAFQVAGPSGPVAGALSVSGSTVTFSPDAPLPRDVPLTVTLTTALRDVFGYALASDHAWTFTIRLTLRTLFGVWGSSGTDVFAVGMSGTILRHDGYAWGLMASPSVNHLEGVWGASGVDVFAVGLAGTVLRYDGASWTSMSSGTAADFEGVWGSSGSDVYAVGRHHPTDPNLLHFDGAAWTGAPRTDDLSGVWGSSAADVFAVGGGVYRLTGSGSTLMTETSSTLIAVWGSSAGDVWAVGTGGTILRYDGAEWSDAR